ncbi:MAG: hypothetical protein MK207_10505 [Saprospiraceae bacterium]|nr:hypothetical protein [Saprospiraceae bacterium]
MVVLTKKEQLQELSEIRSLMERSSRFISLSGMSGISTGISAIIGALIAYWRISIYSHKDGGIYIDSVNTLMWELIIIASVVFIVAVCVAIFFTIKESKKQGQSIFDKSSQQLITNLLIPLVTGGAFCIILIYNNMLWMVAPSTLIFYGLALINASKFTLDNIKYLGFCEIILGLLNGIWMSAGNGLLFWSIGFGLLHIIYGVFMHFKYNKG